MLKIFLLFLALSLLMSCSHSYNALLLKKIQLNAKDIESKTIEIDTIETYPQKGIYFVNIITNRAFGRFSMNYAVIKKTNRVNGIVYLIETKDSIGLRLSKDYISTVKFSDNAWGWFFRKKGILIDTLPMINKILDSLKSIGSNKAFYIAESNGNIFFNLNGKPVKFLNYGNVITKYKNINFDSLEYKLYKQVDDSLIIASNNGNDLVKQQDGVFFIPKPGYGVIEKFDKADFFSVLDSISKLPLPPATFKYQQAQRN